ncbi:hypothetical protein JTB14_036414 [Gonioctena quinquepunctata]|nr:hypothetical protein JTB14_036414 [Gonioctena quinquepunctata]
MKFVLLSVLVSIVVLNEIHCTLKGDWNKFKADYNKSYGNKKEERLRFRNFKTNIKDIRKHNRSFKRNLETFEKGINEFTDLTAHEFKLRYGLFESKNIEIYKSSYKPNISTSVNSSNPEYFDWREKGAVTPAKDQGHCGSCWIYSAIGTLESYYFRKFGKLVTLSEQNVVDCFPDATCLGGLPERAFSFVKKHGINSDSDYPFHEKQGQCNPIKSKYINITYNKLERISGSEEIMKNALIRHGPLEICMYVTKKVEILQERCMV